MELLSAISRRRMVRSFTDRAVAPEAVAALCDLARRAPSAGNTQATGFVVLDEADARSRYWDLTLPEPRRASFQWTGLLVAPVLILVAVRPDAYVERYAEPDKRATGLGDELGSWSVPYWWVDAGAALEHLLLGAVDAGLGACLFGQFEHEPAVAQAFGVPEGWRLVGTVALGHPDPDADRPGRSADRPRPPLDEVMHRNRW